MRKHGLVRIARSLSGVALIVTFQTLAAKSGASQESSPSAVQTGQESVQQKATEVPVAAPLSGPAMGLFPGTGEALLDDGIELHGAVLEHFVANPSAGMQTGNTVNVAVSLLEADLDLDRIIGWSGASLHATEVIDLFKSNEPNGLPSFGGVLTGYQLAASSNNNRLAELTLEQHLLGDSLVVEAGRTNISRTFFLPNGLDLFGQFSSTMFVDADVIPYQYPVWGGRATYFLSPVWYLQTGAFEDDFLRPVQVGYNLGDNGQQGVQFLNEFDYRSTFLQERFPANLEVGFEWNTGSKRRILKANILPYMPGDAAAPYKGGGVIYMQGQKVVWREASVAAGTSPANIAVYGSFDVSVDKPQPIDLDSYAGVQATGLIRGRPFDALALQLHYQRLSRIEAAFETRAETEAGGLGTPQERDGLGLELIYSAALRPWLQFQPLVEYFTAADAYEDPFQPNRPHDGFMAGFYVNVALGRLFGTSHKPF